MFGIDDALIWAPLAGAAVGGMMNKKKPLEGALIGGALGYGGAALPGLLGASAAPSAAGAMAPVETAVSTGGVAANAMPSAAANQVGIYAAPTGSGVVSSGIKDAGSVMQTANVAKSLFPQQKQQLPIAPSPIVQSMPNNAIGQLVSGQDQERMQQAQIEQQKRMKRQQQIGGGLL